MTRTRDSSATAPPAESEAAMAAGDAARPAGTRQPGSLLARLRLRLRASRAGLPPLLGAQIALLAVALGLLILLALRGARLGLESASIVAGEPQHLPLYPWLVRLYDALSGAETPLTTPGHYDLLAALQILAGMLAAWYLAACLRRTLALPAWAAPAGALLLLLPYLFGAEPLGNTVAVAALAYPLYLVALSFLLRGFALGDWRRLIGFLLLLPLLMLSAEPFVFLCPAFVLVLLWLLNGYAGPRAAKLALIGLFLAALLAAFTAERLVNLAQYGRFVAVPVAGIHKIVAPLYLADIGDEQLFVGEPRLRALFHAFQSRMAARNLRREDAQNGLAPAAELVGHYQASYRPIMREVVLPILAQRGRQDWFEIDKVTRQIGWRLLRDKPGAWFSLTLDSIVYGFGGFYPLALLLAALALAGYVQVRRRDGLSLTLATVLVFHLVNVSLAAFFGNAPRAAALYTEPAVIVLLLATLTRLLELPFEAAEEAEREEIELVEAELVED